jgi:acyl-CoA synthetase (NDP forming)
VSGCASYEELRVPGVAEVALAVADHMHGRGAGTLLLEQILVDHVAHLAPLSAEDADEMIHGVRSAPLLAGYRGSPPADLAGLRDLLLRISRLADDLPEVAELDLNPVIARTDGVTAVDARIRIASSQPQHPYLRKLR